MSEQELANEILFKMVCWINKEDRELMMDGLAEELGPQAREMVEEYYKIHAINGTE